MDRIAKVTARALSVPVSLELGAGTVSHPMEVCVVEIETEAGLTGHGISSITEVDVVAAAVRNAARLVEGESPLEHERLWEALYWHLSPRGQTGIAAHAIAAIDVALWDLKGQILGQPIWRLLGGARRRVETYATFGFDFFSREDLAAAAQARVAQGFRRLKMTVGHNALRDRDKGRSVAEVIAEDAERIRAVRAAVGEGVGLYLDANCGLDYMHALQLAQKVREVGIVFFEEPLKGNDTRQMAELRRAGGIPLACGQNEGTAIRFRELLVAGAVDVVQPHVAITGGFTQCARIAALAHAFDVPIANGGAYHLYNMHLQAGAPNGTLCEYHTLAVEAYKLLVKDAPEPKDGWIEMTDKPGLGFALDPDAVADCAFG